MIQVDIAELFGIKDHSSISLGLKAVNELLETNKLFRRKYEEIDELLK